MQRAKAATDAKAPTDQPAGKSDEKPATPTADAATTTPATAAPPAAETAPAAKPSETAPAPGSAAATKRRRQWHGAGRTRFSRRKSQGRSIVDAGRQSCSRSVATKAAAAAGATPAKQSGWSLWVLAITLAGVVRSADHGGQLPGDGFGRCRITPGRSASCSACWRGRLLICLFGEFKFGPDLAGGITLIYELADAPTAVVTNANQPQKPGATAAEADQERRPRIHA